MLFRGVFFPVAACLALAGAAASEVASHPVEFRDGFLWVKVAVAGEPVPLNFVVDSGAALSVLDVAAARRLGMKLGGAADVRGVAGQLEAKRVGGIRAMVGAVPMPRSVLAIDLSPISRSCHQPIDGLIGADFFRGRIVQLDYGRGALRILTAYEPGEGSSIVPMKMRNGVYSVPVEVAGKPLRWMRLDTGCDTAVEWVVDGGNLVGRPSASVGFRSGRSQVLIADVRLGGEVLRNVKTGVHAREFFAGEGGLLGNAVLSQFLVTVDGRQGRLVLEDARR